MVDLIDLCASIAIICNDRELEVPTETAAELDIVIPLGRGAKGLVGLPSHF
jgi:hypothetical protein